MYYENAMSRRMKVPVDMLSFSSYSKGDTVINVTPAEVNYGDEVEITCSFVITSHGPRTIILESEKRQLVTKYEQDFLEIVLPAGIKCARILYLIHEATLADAGVYKCLATGRDESLQYGEATYNLTVLRKFFKTFFSTGLCMCNTFLM